MKQVRYKTIIFFLNVWNICKERVVCKNLTKIYFIIILKHLGCWTSDIQKESNSDYRWQAVQNIGNRLESSYQKKKSHEKRKKKLKITQYNCYYIFFCGNLRLPIWLNLDVDWVLLS